ncbi:MAG: UvrD-helicase domain-containing protein [Flavobacteriales bacterium]|nr:UvrD-helicase domain-containing protein [Flavobacteriales bacterium]MCB9196391.1 UvrD-helicase domain-containing protein [Flavobacteriales bacterium]MCB9198441.1 UvrD-helicase domain-containing protein [Flavobacteriales bacterium]
MEYLNELNDPQRAAAAHLEGPMMVIAGAGSGKTRVLTYRIAHLIDNGVDPFNILALTFTNKAAKEMKERIGKMMGGNEARNIWMGTFHSVFARILRSEYDKIGYPSNFTIYDTQDSKNLLKAIIKEMGLDDKLYKPNIVYGRISSAKNNLISPQAYLKNAEIVSEDQSNARPKMGEIYLEYAKRCYRAGAMDFDDLLFITNVLLKKHPDVLLKYQEKFKYILVDEYQDTNYSQYLIVKRLAARYENLCVVGDDAQSIYAFRGANIQNILNFKRDYPDYKLYKLEQNYRSTQTIVDAANSIIENNRDQIKKDVWTSNPQGDLIRVVRTFSDNEEGKYVANDIFEGKNNLQAKNNEFAILYRTNAQSRSMEEALRKINIPYKIYGGLSFYQRKEIKDLLAYFRLAANHKDEEAFKRIVNYPKRGIGDSTVDKLIIGANNGGASLWDAACNPAEFGVQLSSGVFSKLQQFTLMIRSFASRLDSVKAFELADEIAKVSGIYKELYADKTPEGVSRYENIQELLNGIQEFTNNESSEEKIATLSDFLIDVALLTDADNEDEEDKDKVTLMTIHSAKGLEFPYVYIVGMEESLFPSQLSISTRSELEEERRLFYVAVTRAEKRCTLSYATSRYKWGQLQQCEPSRFIEEIDSKFLDMSMANQEKSPMHLGDDDFGFSGFNQTPKQQPAYLEKYKNQSQKFTSGNSSKSENTSKPNPGFGIPKNLKKVSGTTKASKVDVSKVIPGAEVLHDRFGKGKVLNVEDGKATVFFPSHGQKQLLLQFAKLEVL